MDNFTTRLKNFGKALKKHAKDDFKPTTPSELEDRLNTCNTCDQNLHGVCKECGCFIFLKSRWRSEDCPLEKWKKLL